MNKLAYTVHPMNTPEKEKALTLELLQAVEQESAVTQRGLAASLGVALGMANAYLKRCIRKGLIKVSQAPANRYLYYLTPKGFAEKSRLTADFLRDSFDFYRHAGDSMSRVFKECESRGLERVVLCGASELAEISLVRALEYSITISGILDEETDKTAFLGLPVYRSIADTASTDAYVVTDIYSAEARYQRLLEQLNPQQILVPDILGISQLENEAQ